MDEIELIKMFGISLFFTMIVEITVSIAFGIYRVRQIMLVILINILTNPLAVFFYWIGSMYVFGFLHLGMQLAIECMVVTVEALIYCSFSKKEMYKIKNPILFAVTSNICSWLFGICILS